MKSSKTPRIPFVLGAWFAALAILANTALHSAWAQEMPFTGGPDGSFSICLAHGGSNGQNSTDSGDPTGSAIDRCDLCVIPAGYAGPMSEVAPTPIVFKNTSAVVYGYADAKIRSQDPGITFEARGPPA
jgi:hypothetical protein